LVADESTECPVCGRTYTQALVRKVLLWTVIIVPVIGAAAYHFHHHLAH
jgi:hypothetical protein